MTEDDEFIDAVPADYLEPGETATVDVDGVPVTVANAGGTWCAFESQGPHQATPLGGIPLTRNVLLRCPEHGSMFDVTTVAVPTSRHQRRRVQAMSTQPVSVRARSS